jgi:hypothetical protein
MHNVLVVCYQCSGHTRIRQISHSVNTFRSLSLVQTEHLFLFFADARVVRGLGVLVAWAFQGKDSQHWPWLDVYDLSYLLDGFDDLAAEAS